MLEALDRIERQLVHAAAARGREAALPAPRRRGAPRVAVALLGALVLASGASAVTGVGPLGDVFDGEEIGLSPGADGAGTTVSQRGSDGSQHTMRAYENREGALCVQSPPVEGPPAGEVAVSCSPPGAVSDAIARGGTFATVSASGTESLFFGLVPGGVSSVTVEVAGGPAREAAVGGDAIDGLTPFLVVLDGRPPSVSSPALLTFDDGSRAQWPPRD